MTPPPTDAPGGRTPSAELERAVLDAAHQVLADHGPQGLSVREICKTAGVAPMGLYSRFGSKHGVVDALFADGFVLLRSNLAAMAAEPTGSRLRYGCMAYRDFAMAHPTLYSVMFDRAIPEFEPSDTSMERAYAAFNELVVNVQTAMESGVVAPANPTDVAHQIWAAIHGAVSLELRGVGFIDDPAATYRHLVDSVLAGLGT
jgi:AcrR family transcriptional regulator